MATINLDSIIKAGLVMAFILPALAIISNTLPPPATQPGGTSITQQLNQTGIYIYNSFTFSYINSSRTLLGKNCGAPTPAGIPNSNLSGTGGKNCSGSFYANPTIFQAFAFVLDNLGTVITDIVQLPYLDWLSINLMIVGMSTVIPGFPLQFISIGGDLLYLYMGFSLLLMSIGLLQKYNPKVGIFILPLFILIILPLMKNIHAPSSTELIYILSATDVFLGIIVLKLREKKGNINSRITIAEELKRIEEEKEKKR